MLHLPTKINNTTLTTVYTAVGAAEVAYQQMRDDDGAFIMAHVATGDYSGLTTLSGDTLEDVLSLAKTEVERHARSVRAWQDWEDYGEEVCQ